MMWKINSYLILLFCVQFVNFSGTSGLLAPPKPDNKLITNEEISHHLLDENGGIRENEDFLPIITSQSKTENKLSINDHHLLNENDGIRENDEFSLIRVLSNNTQSNDIITTSSSDKECPHDSFLTHDNRCECKPCIPKQCDPDAKLIEMEPGLPGEPGLCCPIYKCITPCKAIDGTLIDHNTWWIENCQNCTCYNGIGVECFGLSNCNNRSQVQTVDDSNTSNTCITSTGELVLNGGKWSPDYCTVCTCEMGDLKCIAHFCEGNSEVKRIQSTTVSDDYNLQNCDPLFDCNLQCEYGYRVKNDCETCECALSLEILNFAKQRNISIDDAYLLIQTYNSNIKFTQQTPSSSGHWTIFLSVAIMVLFLICCVLIWCLIRNMKLQNTKMDVVCKTHELKKLVNGQTYDTGINATYKYTTNEYTK
ncbi:uncharacterized protein LOC123292341 [Chrysoperla carnea]|uniref:uncharacterized protein LOC123292341 n=1 Tax=Chrysoperla carnea TaxID=189513 RepID=UPI001D0973A0|nr:uncharacterized protein LOC123292341 [Chrysoperla carnea]